MRTVLVTLISPNRTLDLALDADTPARELLPSLLAACDLQNEPDPGRWSLALGGRAPIDADRTLEEEQVLDGSILVLKRNDAQTTASRRPEPRPARSEGSPRARTLSRLAAQPTDPATMISGLLLTRAPTIAVVSPKGGVGKTTTTILLGEIFSSLRPEPVFALDGDADYGSLSRIGPAASVSVLREISVGSVTFADLDRMLWRLPAGLRIVPAPTTPIEMAAIDRLLYARAIGTLQRFGGVLLIDCGSGLAQPSVQAAIVACDQILMMTDASQPTAALAGEATALLARSGRPVTVVCNRLPRRGGEKVLTSLQETFADASGLIGLPEDDSAALAMKGTLQASHGSNVLRESTLALAQLLADDWVRLGLGVQAR